MKEMKFFKFQIFVIFNSDSSIDKKKNLISFDYRYKRKYISYTTKMIIYDFQFEYVLETKIYFQTVSYKNT